MRRDPPTPASTTDDAFIRRLWMRSLSAIAPILRELALDAPTRAGQTDAPTASELEKAAHVIERTAQSLQRLGGVQ